MRKILLLLLVTFFLFGCATTATKNENNYFVMDDPAVVEKLDSAEYKMLIKLADYSPEELWALMKEAAAETKVEIKEVRNPMKRNYRDIQYIDSEFGMVNNFGYVLRYRRKYEKFMEAGSAENIKDSKYDITIKFRDDDINKSINIPLSVGEKYKSIKKKPEMESDISPYGIKYSWAIKVKPKVAKFGEFANLFEPNIASYSELFPNLVDIGLDGNTKITPVAGLTILEEKVEPAILYLTNGVKMEVAFSVFYLNGEALVSEVSFDFDTEYKVDGVKKKMTVKDFKQTEKFYRAILKRYDTRLDFGWSKTKFVYDTLFPDAQAE